MSDADTDPDLLILELAKKELSSALHEWTVDAVCSGRQLTDVEERLFKAVQRHVQAKRKASGVHKLKK